MKIIRIVLQLLVLYGFLLIGEAIQTLLNLPMPGSIIGFLLLFLVLLLKIYPLEWIDVGATFLLSFLSLYFIPATVGVVEYGPLFSGKGVLLLPIVIISTLLTMAAAGLASQTTANRSTAGKEEM
ncbi:CidA/LrgA family holin-like protein [Planococcus sp. ISL-109]|uniref:CidA/LrgA family protein n=1 Tax=Planococcus sp. ISL-109 TaxID=2819166 RepID=UPI001BE9F0F9|nr:CidA/LrgA family holin-like protein [Planococcus sp. ISL-109]MBT2581512.1 CidA/LrgA family holin-like protein [Planococcus sp. ISL-109]